MRPTAVRWMVVPVAGLVLAGCGSTAASSSSTTSQPASAVGSSSPTASTASAVPVPAASPLADKPMAASDSAAIDAVAAKALKEGGAEVPGLVIGVWDPAKGFYVKGYGVGNTATNEPITPDDVMRIGSITKTFVATLVLQLVAEGKIDLDETAGTYVPDLAGKHPEAAAVTIRQLLSMRSGLPDYEKAITGRAASEPEVTTKAWTADEIVDAAFAAGKAGKPDQTPAVYTNTNYVILGEVLEAVTGQSVGELVQSRLLDPNGLTSTVYPDASDTSLPDPHAQGYVPASAIEELTAAGGTLKPGTDVTDWSASWGGAAGIMNSTVADLAHWAALGFGSDTLPADLQAERQKMQRLDVIGQYGLGLQKIGQWEGHLGGIPGWTTLALRNTDTGVVVVMAANSTGAVALIQLGILDTLYPGALE